MSRDFYINGESMVTVKGPSDSVGTGSVASLVQLGLTESPIRVRLNIRHRDLIVDAWGPEVPADVQCFLTDATISMNLIHYDPYVLDECVRLGMFGNPSVGFVSRAGIRMGSTVAARFAPGNNFIGLNIASPVVNRPYRFFLAYLTGPAAEFPLGTEKTVAAVTWRAIPYYSTSSPPNDPWGAGTGSRDAKLWDSTADT